MKKVLLILLLMGFTSVVSAAPVTQGGFEYTPVTKTLTASSSATDTAVWTPASGRKINLLGASFSSNSAANFLIEDGSTAVIPTTYTIASGIAVIGNGTPIWKGTADGALTATISGEFSNTNYTILLWGFESSR